MIERLPINHVNPPRLAEAVLQCLLPPRDRDTIGGDLLEEYREVALPNLGVFRARLWYLRHTLSLITFERLWQHAIKSFRTYPKAALALGCFCTALLGMTLNDLTRSPEAHVALIEAGQALTVQGRVAMVRIESGNSLIRVERTDGTGKYEFMTAAARDLAEQGFTRSTMNPGDRVIVTGVSVDGAKLRADKITKPDGSILFDRAVLAATR